MRCVRRVEGVGKTWTSDVVHDDRLVAVVAALDRFWRQRHRMSHKGVMELYDVFSGSLESLAGPTATDILYSRNFEIIFSNL